jgi:hypothetical protein
MSRLFFTGFEVGTIEICHEVGGMGLSTPPGWIAAHTGDYQAVTEATQYAIIDLDKVGAGVATNPLYLRFYIAVSVVLTGTAAWLELLDESNNPHLRFLTMGTVQYWDGGAWQSLGDFGELTSFVGDPSWHRWELFIDIDHAPNGQVIIYKDGVEIFNVTGQTWGLNPFTDFVVHKIAIGNYSGVTLDPGEYIAYDDIAVNDELGTKNNSYPGPGSIHGLRPTADGFHSDYVPLPAGGGNYDNVDDEAPDDETTILYPCATDDTDTYPMELLSDLGISDLAIIRAVAWQMRTHIPADGSAGLAPIYRYQNVSTQELATETVDEVNWHYITHIEEDDPFISGDWVADLIDSGQFGFRQK